MAEQPKKKRKVVAAAETDDKLSDARSRVAEDAPSQEMSALLQHQQTGKLLFDAVDSTQA